MADRKTEFLTPSNLIMTILALAFAGWGSVVYSLGSEAIDRLDLINSRLAVVETRLLLSAERVDRHIDRPWHNEAGETMQRMAAQLDGIEARLDRLSPSP